jgi:hypothetical protein
VPATEADRSPGPTKDANEGSWPLPPPEIMLTCGVDGVWERILLGRSHCTEGLRRGMLRRAVETRCVGSWMKCFAGIVC